VRRVSGGDCAVDSIRGLTRSAAKEYGPRGVRINELQPGVIDSEMAQANPEATQQVANLGVPMGRVGTGEQIATAVAFLLSDDASYITGAHLAVDGGFLAWHPAPSTGSAHGRSTVPGD
jgi:NAD(P)-dependent dehydrogenase (short-subunit alcohol dehydrogenase family)